MPIKLDLKNISNPSNPFKKALRKIYHTHDGIAARKLNKTAQLRDPIKAHHIVFSKELYPLASKKDLALLLSDKEEDLLKKCTFIHPKNLKEYNILFKKKNADKSIKVRILDSKGGFIKEADIKPKNVVVLDNFSQNTTAMLYDGSEQVPHGNVVQRLIQRSNPFNNYEFIDISSSDQGNKMNSRKAIEDLIKRVRSGEKIDAVSCSFAREFTYEQLEEILRQPIKNKPMIEQRKIIIGNLNRLSKMNDKELEDYFKNIIDDYKPEFLQDVKAFINMNKEIKLFERLNKMGVKIFMGSGNAREVLADKKVVETINYNLLADGVEGVGALDTHGLAAQYSGSRKSLFTPHYEKGDICIEFREKGFNFSGGLGVDVPYSEKAKSLFQEICSLSPYSKEIKSLWQGYQYKGIPLDLRMQEDIVYPMTIIRNGTSWSTPRRVGEFTKYQMLKDLI